MKKIILSSLSAVMALTLCACSGNGIESDAKNDSEVSSETSNETTSTQSHDVKEIDFTLEGGNLKFVGAEKANKDLVKNNAGIDTDKVIILKYEFTNFQDKPAQEQSVFKTTVYQNGAELSKSLSYNSAGGSQYDLCGAYFNSAMKDGTVAFGRLVLLEDYSPITIYAEPNGFNSDEYQVMTLDVENIMSQKSDDLEKKETDSSNTQETTEEKAKKLKVGQTVTSEDWSITLASAYTSDTLASDQSKTYWEAEDGYAFLILEFDIECLNSSQKAVDKDAVTNLVATVNGNTYKSWEYQYIAGELWLYFRNTYLDANLPEHAYIYTYVPSKVMNDKITVDMKLAGKPYQLTIN